MILINVIILLNISNISFNNLTKNNNEDDDNNNFLIFFNIKLPFSFLGTSKRKEKKKH